MKKKRPRVIDSAKARLAAGGGIERYESNSTELGYLPCSRCEQESATVPPTWRIVFTLPIGCRGTAGTGIDTLLITPPLTSLHVRMYIN